MRTVLVCLCLFASFAANASPWTIPPEGACAPQGGLTGWPIGEDAPPIPFEPGDPIDISRLTLLRSYLPPEIWEHRERFFFEGMTLEIGPCFRPDDPDRPVRVIDSVAAAFAKIDLRGSWRRESGDMISLPPHENQLRLMVSVTQLTRRH